MSDPTEGPYKIAGNWLTSEFGTQNAVPLVVSSPDEIGIAGVFSLGSGLTPDVALANARLLAASWEMKKQLTQVRDALGQLTPKQMGGFGSPASKLFDDVRALLNKIDGKG